MEAGGQKTPGSSQEESCKDQWMKTAGRELDVAKRNFNRFMTRLGAHIIHLATFGGSKLLKLYQRILQALRKKLGPPLLRIRGAFRRIKRRNIHKLERTQQVYWSIKDRYLDRRVNEGFFPAVAKLAVDIGKSLWQGRRAAVSLFNWVAPVVSVAFLVSVVHYASNLNYGISVECNGQKLGVISQEVDYEEAAKEMQQKITYVDGNSTVIVKPKLSVQVVEDGEEIVNAAELADKLIVTSDAELVSGYGVYVDGSFLGAVTDTAEIQETLDDMLESYDGPGVKDLELGKEVQYKDGLYLADSIVDQSKIVETLESDVEKEAYYTIQAGDTPILIAANNNMDYDEMVKLNPNIESDCRIGDQVLLNRPEPFIPVKVVKEVTYTKPLSFETEEVENSELYKGNREIMVEGQYGEQAITAEVVMVNGYEVGRNVLSTKTVKEPVAEKISVGTKVSSPSKGTTITGNGEYAWPLAGGYISAHWGDNRGHRGLDIAAPAGTSIFAAASGTVIDVNNSNGWGRGYGKYVLIQNDDGNVTMNAHQSNVIAQLGQKVSKGELIGQVGRTGDATGNHLHFEVRRNGTYLNAESFIT